MTPDDPRHGTSAGYCAGCRERCCRKAMADWTRHARTRRYLHGPLKVAPLGTTRRLQALVALGYSTAQLDAALGQQRTYVLALLARDHLIHRTTAHRVAALYDHLSMRPPDESTQYKKSAATRSRSLARRNGWAPPLAWEGIDIDDPAARPEIGSPARPKDSLDEVVVERVMRGERLPMTHAERVAVVSKMRAQGHGLTEIEARTGIKKPYRYAGSDGLVA